LRVEEERIEILAILKEARERRTRLVAEQKGKVSKVLLEGLYDPDCSLNKLHRGRGGQDVLWIVWKLVIKDWQGFSEDRADGNSP